MADSVIFIAYPTPATLSPQNLYPIDKLTKKLAKRWLHLPQRASAEVVYLLPSQGGAGLLPLTDGIDIATVTQAYRMLTCNDRFVQKVAWSCLRTVARRKTGISNPSEKELADYLIHKGRPVGDISNWRPLAMGNCVAKLYAAVLADRITVWAQRETTLSRAKGLPDR